MNAIEFDIEAAAMALIQARQSRRQFASGGMRGPQSDGDAYAIQDRVRSAIDPGPVAAWKVGTTARGNEPSAAPIIRSGVFATPARVAASSFHMLAAEAEIAFRFARDLEPGCTEEEVARAIDSAIVAIELCDTRLQDFKGATAWWKLADNQSNYGLVLGSGRGDWQSIDFTTQPAEFRVNGRLKNSAVGVHPLGSPFGLLPWLAAHVEKRGERLRAGNVVTTGAWTGLELVLPGDLVVARFPGIGEAQVTLAL